MCMSPRSPGTSFCSLSRAPSSGFDDRPFALLQCRELAYEPILVIVLSTVGNYILALRSSSLVCYGPESC